MTQPDRRCLTRVLTLALAGALACGVALRLEARGNVIRVHAGDDLQEALDRAEPGDTLLLDRGATFVGNFVLPTKDGDAYITVRSSVDDAEAPGEGQRVMPHDAPLLATLRSPNALPVLRTAPGAHHWRLVLLRFAPNATPGNDLIRLGDGSAAQASRAQVPHHLEIDRCYLHGDPHVGQKRGVALNSASTRIVNSYFADFKLVGQDSQAIAGWNGPGPFTIENNYLEAAGENVLFGGADAATPELMPADIAVRDNHVSKPTSWRRERWEVKNLLELKAARAVVIEHNLFEHNWQAAQPGPAILFTPRNQHGGAPWSAVRDVTFRGNIVRHVAAGINVLGYDNLQPSERTERVSIHHNQFVDVDAARWGGNGAFLLIGGGPADISVDHNTVAQSGSVIVAYGAPVERFVFTNNLVRHNAFGIKGDARGIGRDTLHTYFPGAVVTHNVFADGPAALYPPGNFFPPLAQWWLQFVDAFGGDYRLAATSLYRHAGTDGEDLGAASDMIARAADAPLGRRVTPPAAR